MRKLAIVAMVAFMLYVAAGTMLVSIPKILTMEVVAILNSLGG